MKKLDNSVTFKEEHTTVTITDLSNEIPNDVFTDMVDMVMGMIDRIFDVLCEHLDDRFSDEEKALIIAVAKQSTSKE